MAPPALYRLVATKDHTVMVELKAFERHRMLTRTVAANEEGPGAEGARMGGRGSAGGAGGGHGHAESDLLDRDVPNFQKVRRVPLSACAPHGQGRYIV